MIQHLAVATIGDLENCAAFNLTEMAAPFYGFGRTVA